MKKDDRLIKKEQSARLRRVRQVFGLMQIEMADKLNYKRSTYNQVENGLYKLNSQALLLLKVIFNINPDWYLTGQGEMYIKDSAVTADEWKARYEACRAEVSRLNAIIDGLVKR